MTRILVVETDAELTEEEKKRFDAEVQAAKSAPIVFDDDCSELSPVMMKALKSAVANRNRRMKAKAQ